MSDTYTPTLPPPPPPTPKKKMAAWKKAGLVILATLAGITILGAVVGPAEEEEPAAAAPTPSSAPKPAATPPSSAAPPAAPDPALAEAYENGEWVIGGGMDALQDLIDVQTELGETTSPSALMAGCASLVGPASALQADLPDTQLGAHFGTAMGLILQAADACMAGDFDTATGLIAQSSVSIDLATAELAESTAVMEANS